jgi:cytochrome c
VAFVCFFAAGAPAAEAAGTFQKELLSGNTLNPMELAVAPDGRVFFAERGGDVKIFKPSTKSTVVAGHVNVFTGIEDGLLGIALHPGFASNGWLYVFYSPAGTNPVQELARFTVVGDRLDPASKKVFLRFETQRDLCCHSAGSLAFGPDGNLYISTGDNTYPFASQGYAPIDETPGRWAYDAQRSSGNTNDLRGKVLRIRPTSAGGYRIPAGNLFSPTSSVARAEIYAMGLRNPFRISVDPGTGWLFVGDVGPDASNDSSSRGPRGYDELNLVPSAGNYGWPYCLADNKPYGDYNFETGVTRGFFDCAAARNDSPRNSGARILPPARSPLLSYPYDATVFGSGARTVMAGPVYRFASTLASPRKFPASLNGSLFLYDWSRNWIKTVELDGQAQVVGMADFMAGTAFRKPIDMAFGPDGALYLLEWGSSWNNNDDSGLYRINFVSESEPFPGDLGPPLAKAKATPNNGALPLTVQFSSEGSSDPDGKPLTYGWDFTSDGTTDSTAENPTAVYTTAGDFTARLTVTDAAGRKGTADVRIAAGNTRPTVQILRPVNGGFVNFRDSVRYRIAVLDPEDGTFSCSRVRVHLTLGHGTHGHTLKQLSGCTGVFRMSAFSHPASANLFYALEASYTDRGAPGVQRLTGSRRHILQPKLKQAEFFTRAEQVNVVRTADASGRRDVFPNAHGAWVSYNPTNLRRIESLAFRVASRQVGGRIDVRVDSPTGPIVASKRIPRTGSLRRYATVRKPVARVSGTHELFLVFHSGPGTGELFKLNWIRFSGLGVATG